MVVEARPELIIATIHVDCNEVECQGRNPQHTDKPCSVGWGYYHNKDIKI